jgi:tetratricopeptide (TPR) repeat protein
MLRAFFLIFLFLPEIYLFGQNSRAHIKAAEQYIANGFYDEAIDQYNKAIELDPQNGHAYEGRAKALEHTKELGKAATDYLNAAVFASNPAINYLKAAEIFYSLKKLDASLEATDKAISQNQKYYEAYLLQSKIFYSLDKFHEALASAENAIASKSAAYAYYLKGLSEFALNDLKQAESDFEKAIVKDKLFVEAYLTQAQLQLQNGKIQNAIENCNYVIMNDRSNKDAYIIRSKGYFQERELEKAISDASKAIFLDSLNIDYYLQRGDYYLEYAQFQNAINDYFVVLNLDAHNFKALQKRATAYEKIGEKKKAVSDYTLLLTLNKKSDEKYVDFLAERVFELKRESNKPIITLIEPQLTNNFEVPVPSDNMFVTIKGVIYDESRIKLLRVNNDTLFNDASVIEDSVFTATINSKDIEFVTVSATDIYDNLSTINYAVQKIETHPPRINLLNPYVHDDNIITLGTDDNFLYIEGRIEDESLISDIHIDKVNASYVTCDINPRFTATLDIANKNRIKIAATDIYGNKLEKEYLFLRNDRILSDDSPMGKTWVVMIENSEYKDFTNLNSPAGDIKSMEEALSHYKINNIIIKKNLTKRELERFFSIDLRDLMRINHVNSLFVWYAGHGKNINGNGYWIPSDAIMDDEFSYYNINALKASLYSYTSLTHLLIVSDACSTGSSFNIAMRGTIEGAECSQTQLTFKKSAQVFTSAGQGNANDNSLFTRAFANALLNNENTCVTIDEIAKRVSIVVQNNSSQSPEFGHISGIEDQQGTFFFIAR